MATDTRRLRVVVTGDSGGAQQAIEAVGDSAEKSENAVSRWSSRFGAAVGSITKIAGLAAGVAGALFGLSVIQKGVDRLATIEDATVALKVALGSAAKAGKVMDDVLAVVKGTPFNLDQFATAAKNLVVFGVSANKVPKYLHAIGEAAAASGAGAEAVGVLVNAFGDATTIGRITGETIQTLASQGVPALKILANHFGISTGEMQKMISKGAVPAAQGMDILVKGIEKGSKGIAGTTVALGGSMEGLRKTFRGSLGGMQAAMARFGASIVGPFMGDITKGMTGFATSMDSAGAQIKGFLTSIAKSPLWQDIVTKATELPAKAGKALSDFFAGLQGKGELAGFSGTVNEIGLGLRAMVGAFKDGDVTSDGLVGNFEKLGVTAKIIVGVIGDITRATIEVVGWMRKHEDAVKAVTAAIVALIAITKIHAAVLAVQGAGGMAAYLGNLKQSFLALKAVTTVTKTATAVQWAWNIAIMSNPFGLIILAIMAVVAVIVLLWKKNENFRKNTIQAWNQLKMVVGAVASFFTDVVWPAIKTALGWIVAYYKGVWTVISTVTSTVVGAVIAAVDWLKGAWNASWGAVKAAAAAVAGWFMAYLWPTISAVITNIGKVLNFLYNAVWKPIWILIQIAAKIAAFYFQNVIMPIFKFVFSGIMLVVNTFVAGWQFWWGIIKSAAGAVAGWFNNTIVPSLRKAFDQLMGIVNWFKDRWNSIWGGIKSAAGAVAGWFTGTIVPSLRKAFDQLMAFLGFFKTGWDREWGRLKKITESVTSAIAKAFKWAKDEIGREWSKLQDIAKKPVSFMVNTVYNQGIRKLWNKVAEKFGIKTTLDEIKFAKGGVLPGYAPRKDRVPAVLSPGEGVAVPELIKQIGVNRFLDWNKKAREGRPIAFADGGIVGWGKSLLSKGKDIIQGIASPVVNKLIDGLKPIVNAIPGTGGFADMMRSGGHKILDNFKTWVSGKDKAALDLGTHLSGTAGGKKLNGMGWQMQMFLLRNRFPGLQLISGYRPGAVTLTGNRSYHSLGRAVDVPPRKDVFNWIKGTFGPAIKELIFSPMGKGQVWNGRNHLYREPVRGQHWNHVHWAMDNGGVLPPNSTTTVTNATSRREYMLTEDKLQRLGGVDGVNIENLNVTVEGDISDAQAQKAARKIRDELVKLGNRNGGRPALTPAS